MLTPPSALGVILGEAATAHVPVIGIEDFTEVYDDDEEGTRTTPGVRFYSPVRDPTENTGEGLLAISFMNLRLISTSFRLRPR